MDTLSNHRQPDLGPGLGLDDEQRVRDLEDAAVRVGGLIYAGE
jgi:hypothetical protein